jgi:hypothetical protein
VKLLKTAILLAGVLACFCAYSQSKGESPLEFSITFPESLNPDPVDGRLLLIIARDNDVEPRFQIDRSAQTQQIFGIDVDRLQPGESAQIDDRVFGNPLESLAAVPAGEYWVQAVLHKYETFHRADGHTVELPMDRGEGQKWNRAQGSAMARNCSSIWGISS